MKSAFVGAGLATLATFAGSMRLWWLYTPRTQSRYLWDYVRYALGVPTWKGWPYRIEAVQHKPIRYLPDVVYGGQELWMVLLWPLVATAIVAMISLFLAGELSKAAQFRTGRVLRGPKVISNLEWWWNGIGKKKGFYIQQ
jgi:hypothetical protein